VQKEAIGRLTSVGAGGEIDSRGTYQVAAPFPVLRQEGLHERGKGRRVRGASQLLEQWVGGCSVGDTLQTGHWRSDPNRGEDLVLKRPESWDPVRG
jgi:hypothetical protein